jgi:penicillin-binding protein 2
MYDRRVKVFIALNLLMVVVCLFRLVQMQWLRSSSIQDEINRLEKQQLRSTQLKTIRGSILDRNGRVLAADAPQFQVTLSYRLSSYADKNVQTDMRSRAKAQSKNPSGIDVENRISARLDVLKQIIIDCNDLGADADDLLKTISQANDLIWKKREFLAWARSKPDPNLLAKYDDQKGDVPMAEAFADFAQRFPDPEVRLKMIAEVNPNDLPEDARRFPLVELTTDEDLFKAQMQFMDMDANDIQVVSSGNRFYPYGSAAAQTIGWVGGVGAATAKEDKQLFKDDPLARYLETGDVCGREDGVEYVCEAILRGRRGEEVSDTGKNLVSQTQPEFGRDVQLTIDIELQRQIEQWISDPSQNADFDANTAVVVLDIRSGDILAMVSLPSYDLNRVRYDYNDLSHSPDRPLINRTINALYPPGSVVKPLILAAGLQSGEIGPDEVIHCREEPAPKGWPDCSIWKEHHGAHDNLWANDARHAIQGSCNIYFSRLADRLNPKVLQQWLFKFGYGHQILDCGLTDFGLAPYSESAIRNPQSAIGARRLKESAGQLGSTGVPTRAQITSLAQIPRLNDAERRFFGIGQGNLRVTPLQVANSFAALARGGQYKLPRLFLQPKSADAGTLTELVDLGISLANLQVIYDGMSAVVNELHGTAYDAFHDDPAHASPLPRDVKVYGKTGSTERPAHAWFAGFVEDRTGARIAVAVVVEGGEHGGKDAAPIGREVIKLCAQAGYVGTPDSEPATKRR